MMTVHKLSAGDGYRYYTGEVASGDVLRDKNRELGDYYTVEGMPPGQWLGSGASKIGLFGRVNEAQMQALFSGQQLPLTTEELAELLAQKPDAAEAKYASTLEEKRLQYAEKAWEIHLAIKQGKTQEEISKSFIKERSQKAISLKIEAYKAAGNDFSKTNKKAYRDPKNLETLRQNFINSYTMTQAETKRAQNKARQEANKTLSVTSRKNAEAPRTYEKVKTPFMVRMAEEKARFIRLNDRQPSKDETREIRNRVGGELFRKEHLREPRTKEELSRWITQQSKPKQQTITGFDLVFTPTKSVSIAWGLGDETLRKGIETAHEKAIQDVITYLENNAVYTRRGKNGIAQENVQSGIIATKFRHYDSRNGDPNLHDHLVIANKVQGKDGKWLTLDGRMIYSYNVAASELYNSKIAEYIHADLGLEFTGEKRKGRKIYELEGIDSETIQAFSSRSSSIKKTLEELKAKYIQEHGYAPNDKALIALRQQATLATRPKKEGAHSLAELNEKWRHQVAEKKLKLPTGEKLYQHLKKASNQQAEKVIEAKAQALATPAMAHAERIIGRLQESRSTWKINHIEAETLRYFRDVTKGSGLDKTAVDAAVSAVINQSISINNFGEAVELPEAKLRNNGTSVYRRADYQLFSSHAIFEAERTLIQAATTDKVIPVATHDLFERQVAQLKAEGGLISSTQEDMARAFVTDERLLVVGIGPAGAGKTTSMKAAVDTARAGGHKVIGLAPTAVAASIMEKELDIQAMTVAKFTNPKAPRIILEPGTVLLVDEIGMASTLDLAKIVDQAREQGAVVRGIGDYRQLSAIGSGGALRMIESEAGAIYLEDVFRFKNSEEAAATLALREPPLVGVDKPFGWYVDNGRVTAGEKDVMLADVYAAFAADTAAGKNSLMLAPTNEDVKKLNEYAQVAAIDAGKVKESAKRIALLDDGSNAYKGDIIVTRDNNYKLRLNKGKDFVKNGDLWKVQKVTLDGDLKVKHLNHGGVITLPSSYVKQYVQLGYASTINRAQGSTVDTVHPVVDASTSRANAYVALSRGRESNRLYVATAEGQARDDVLGAITNNFDRNLSFHEETRAQRAAERNVAAALEKYDDLSLYASEEAMKSVVTEAIGAQSASAFFQSPAWGALAHELADTYRSGLDPVETFTRAYQQRDLAGAEDVSAVLHWRIQEVRAANEAAQERFGQYARPMAHIPTEQLEQLIARAQQRTKPVKEREIEDKRWIERDYALVPSAHLKEMRVNTVKALSVAESTGDTRAYAQISENLGLMDAEVTRRRWASPAQREVEEIVRGERPRSGADFTILNSLQWEKKIRDTLISEVAAPGTGAKDQIVKGVSGHSLDSFWQYDQYTPDSLKRVLKAQHREVAELVQLRGHQIAAEKPAWADALGQVPAQARNARHWYRVAAEVESFREKYKIPAGEPIAIPKKLRNGERGEFLQTQIVNVHKRSVLSAQHKDREQLHHEARLKDTLIADKEQLSDAENLINQHRTKSDSPEQKQLEHQEKLWQELAQRWETEQQKKAEALDAQKACDVASQDAHSAISARDGYSQSLVAAAHKDYQQVQEAQERVENSNIFNRSSRERELNTALDAYESKYGRTDLPSEDDKVWLNEDARYAEYAQKAQEAEEALAQAQHKLDRANGQADMATQQRLSAYDSYVEAREANPNTRVVSERMTASDAMQAKNKATRRDEAMLRAKMTPGSMRMQQVRQQQVFKQQKPPAQAQTQQQVRQQQVTQKPRTL
ncbi:MobF family relaxase [Rothia nasimurium]|uniref:MobF family relaxase n=1 Tax=Rothia nasimurium TaxID=85336 RepID=UPI002DD69D51|nr:MobF family relaxase [Rothia nasimurium]